MNRHRAPAIVYLMPLVMMGLLLSCGPGLAELGNKISPTAPSLATAAATSTVANTPTATVYYVAVNEPGASDSNTGLYPAYQGDQDGPWLTIQHAANTMATGETTYVRGGTYYKSAITFAHSGVPGAPVTLAGYESEQVIVDGSKAQDDYPGIVIVEGRDHYVIQGLTIRHMSWSGIATDENITDPYQDITIRDCVLHDNGWSGIDLAAVDGFVVENVEAYDMGAFEFAASQAYLPLLANSWDSFGISVVRTLESLSPYVTWSVDHQPRPRAGPKHRSALDAVVGL